MSFSPTPQVSVAKRNEANQHNTKAPEPYYPKSLIYIPSEIPSPHLIKKGEKKNLKK